MVDFIIVAVLLIIVGAAVIYIVKAKKSGAKCIGCPAGGNCSHSHKVSQQSGCSCQGENTCHCQGESTCGCHADTKQSL